ncbi:MAG: response regulator [Bacteroidia bacterium]|nr:response regulator [Bacteroidia bacterium]
MKKKDKASILIIEDDYNDAEFTIKAIKRMSAPPPFIHLSNINEFMEFDFNQHQVGLILLDMKLPKVKGLEILEKIKANRSSCDIPVVVFTSSELPSDVEKAKAMGVRDYVVKPISIDRYFQSVQRVCNQWLSHN